MIPVPIEDEEPKEPRALQVPDFKSTIPEDLMERLSRRDRHTLDTMSITAQKQDWNIGVSIATDLLVQRLVIRQNRTDKILRYFTGWWAPILVVGGLIGPWLLMKILNHFFP
jgi:hypothetical protein